MRRWCLLLALLVACGGASESIADPPGTASPTTTATAQAPAFTLVLGEGGTFSLAEEARPVFMVFWAEW